RPPRRLPERLADHILAPEFFSRLPAIPVINIHPALLPLFGGKGMLGDRVHAAVLAAKAKETGVTVHRVSADTVDTGEVIVQKRVPVHEGDDIATLSARVLAVEHEAIVEAVRWCIGPREAPAAR
ncbi:MAG: formyltransferase family protein, partial [Chloroflexota bacterium]